MKELEKELRDKLIKVLWILVWGCITLDVMFFIAFYVTKDLGTTVPRYVLKYLCVPFIVNMIIYLITKHFNQSIKFSDDVKNLACSLGLCSLGGSMAIFHSYYSPLWCAPCMALMFCSIFHSKKIHQIMLVYSCLLVIIATTYSSLSYKEDIKFYLQNGIVVLGITFLSNFIVNELYKYQQRIELLTKTSSENEEMYRKRLERDLLTGVHSREYMQEIFHKHFGIKFGKEPVGVAILDLDDFKRINDKYGHDNGDIVLRTLGTLLNEYASPTLQVGRFGGEEFVIIFLDANQKEYHKKLEELRIRFSNQDFNFMDEHVTFSAGLVICTSNVAYDKAFQHADQALYQSKGNGKNQITVVDL